jgi:hypothetical protein
LSCGRVISELNNSLPPVLWLIHESPISLKEFNHAIPKEITAKIKIYVASDYCADSLSRVGQDIMLDAIKALDKEHFINARFIFIGEQYEKRNETRLVFPINEIDVLVRHIVFVIEKQR